MEEDRPKKRERDRRQAMLHIIETADVILDGHSSSATEVAVELLRQSNAVLPGFEESRKLTPLCEAAVYRANQIIIQANVGSDEAKFLRKAAAQWLLIARLDPSAKERLKTV